MFVSLLIILSIIAVILDTPQGTLKRSIKICGYLVLFIITATSVFVFTDYIKSEPGNAVKSSYPALQFSQYEVLLSENNNGIFGGHTRILLKIPKEQSDKIIQSCAEHGFLRIDKTGKWFKKNMSKITSLTYKKLGIGKNPACKSRSSRAYNNPNNLQDRTTFILDNGYLYYSSSYR